MTTLSISIPASLAKASQEVAKKLRLSRTQFIRQAILHEVEKMQAKFEQEAIVKSLTAMKNSKSYLAETDEITERLNDDLQSEETK